MAYSDYGAFVYKNGQRMEEFEDCRFGNRIVHGLIHDENIDVVCYKQGLPAIYCRGEKVSFYDEETDYYDFEPFDYEIEGYHFYFENCDKPYTITLNCPNGDVWRCEYDYWYGAGF